MRRLLTIIGARPQIIKAAAISRAVKNHYANKIEEHILHTGQHYDANMSQVFFDELGIPQPNYNLGVGSGSHGLQTAKMISGIEEILLSNHYDGIILYGDTNSTLAGAVAASKIHVPVFHIEAGLRSFNMAMPEEINRIVCDQLSSICFAPTQTAVDNLRHEGFMDSQATFRNGLHRRVCNCGDVMYDNSIYFASIAREHTSIIQDLHLTSNAYILATIHRDNNTDNPQRLQAILKALSDISQQDNIPVILPLHPRTRKILENNSFNINLPNSIRITEPASFFEINMLEQNARIVMTDSGGVQKEAFFFEKPCVILRPETEWVEIVQTGNAILADADESRIMEAWQHFKNNPPTVFPEIFGDGHAAEFMLDKIISCKVL
jgi:UDP-GlcNAc3NAcA epimerase